MADDILVSASTGSLAVPVASDELTELNGQPVAPDSNGRLPQAQRVKSVWGADGVAFDPTPETPFPMADCTPPFAQPVSGGVDVAPDTPTVIAVASSGRAYVAVNLLDRDTAGVQVPASAKLWLGWGSVAVAGSGDWIAFNGRTDQTFFQGDVHVLLKGHDTSVRVTWTEWPA